MKGLPLTRQGGRFLVEMVFTSKEIELLGGVGSVERLCERACEENVRVMNARIEYMKMPVDEDVVGGGFAGGARPGGPLAE